VIKKEWTLRQETLQYMNRREFITRIAQGTLFISMPKITLLAGVFPDNDSGVLAYDNGKPNHDAVVGSLYLQTDIPAHLWVKTDEAWRPLK